MGSGSMVRLGLGLGLVVGACQGAGAFVCTGDGDCTDGGMQGRCEPTGYCSFPDPGCPSMQRYGRHAGELSGECVPLDTGTGSASSASATDTGGGDTTTLGVDGSGPGDETASPADSTGTGGAPTLLFVDDDEQDFTAGELTSVVWVGGGVQLDGGDTGVLVSRVFDAGQDVAWQSLRWIPRGPYGKPLPGQEQSERGYAAGNADMSANLLLLHLEGEGVAGPAALLEDASGHDHDFLLDTVAGLPWVPGPFGTALADDMASYAHNGVWVDAFSFGEDDFSWSMWVRTDVPCDGPDVSDNQVYLGIDGEGAERSHVWLGCRHPTSTHCPGEGTEAGRPGGSFSANQAAGGARLCGTAELVDDQWHHLAVTKVGHANAVFTLYFDGALVDTEAVAFVDPVAFPVGTELALGAFSGGTFPGAGTFDEVAIWRRGLAPSEVQALYHRGVQRLRVQVRTCADPRCGDDGEFVGPDGTDQTAYEDLADALGPDTERALPAGLEGRYFQYRVELEGGAVPSPVLEQVAIEAAAL